MCRLLVSISIVAVLLMSVNAMAAYVIVPVPNGGFELPGDGKHNMWDAGTNAKGTFTDVPNWTSDTPAADSGVESDWPGRTEGLWNGFLMNNPDPSVWQILPYTIQAGDQFMLSVDARDSWTASGSLPAKLQMSLFYVALSGARTPIATQIVTLDGSQGTQAINLRDPADMSWRTYVLNLADASAGVGRPLGIELQNVSTGSNSSWVGIDNVRIPEPTTIALLGLGGLALIRRKRA